MFQPYSCFNFVINCSPNPEVKACAFKLSARHPPFFKIFHPSFFSNKMSSPAETDLSPYRAVLKICGRSWSIIDMIEFGPPTIPTTLLTVIVQVCGYDGTNQTFPVTLPPGQFEEVSIQRLSAQNQPCARPVIYNVPRY
jgi:hypothetical protein